MVLAALTAADPASAAEPDKPADPAVRICDLIELHSERHALPAAFLARLIWKESRFDAGAVSPKGAEGIAQFMPATARIRGLDDSFDIEKAIPASASYLAYLKAKFGNLGLAAAAYNAGEARVSRWLRTGGFLPLETENYVSDILGAPVDSFMDKDMEVVVPPLDPKKPFAGACRELPVSHAAVVAMATTPTKPWGVQVAGHFRRNTAVAMWERLRKQHSLLGEHKPVVSRIRSTRGPRGIYAVRIGADSRDEAAGICEQLRQNGAACIVLKNS